MLSEASDAVSRTFRRRLSRLPAVAFGLAVLLDIIGRFPDTGFPHEGAAWLARLALTAFGLLFIVSLGKGAIRWLPALLGLLLGSLAVWVRGHPAVPADLPVVGANVVVLLLLVWAVRPARYA